MCRAVRELLPTKDFIPKKGNPANRAGKTIGGVIYQTEAFLNVVLRSRVNCVGVLM